MKIQMKNFSQFFMKLAFYFYCLPQKSLFSCWQNRMYAAAAAKLLQSCPTLVWPHIWQPTRLPCPWDSPGKNTGVGCHFLLQCMKVKSESEVAQLCPTLCDPMDCSLPGSSIHGSFQARVLEWGAIPVLNHQWRKNWKYNGHISLEKLQMLFCFDCSQILRHL